METAEHTITGRRPSAARARACVRMFDQRAAVATEVPPNFKITALAGAVIAAVAVLAVLAVLDVLAVLAVFAVFAVFAVLAVLAAVAVGAVVAAVVMGSS